MNKLSVDFTKEIGKIKPMHAVNNGPAGSRGRGSAAYFEEIGIPYARNHDASFCASYGGEHTVDVHAIFPNFDADENNPASYDFHYTDEYCAKIEAVGAKIFYRLGSKIEHGSKKYGTLVPPDFGKWARICEHIIRHLTEGWADGHHFDIEYWEIWNEPDLGTACWQGTGEEFCELFCVTFKHLKACFPHLKIGGPAFTQIHPYKIDETLFYDYLRKYDVKLDFFSAHGYRKLPLRYARDCFEVRESLDREGQEGCEIIINEWNYIKGWSGEDFTYSIKSIIGNKGASFALGAMLGGQKSPMDMFMYYDARPTAFNGLFSFYTYEKLPTFYSFKMFGELYRLGTEVESTTDDEEKLYVCAAKGEGGKLIALTYFVDDSADDTAVALKINGVKAGARMDILLSDENSELETIRTEYMGENETTLYLNLKNYDRLYIKIFE